MTGINLLPWRAERRDARDRQMIMTTALVWLGCGVLVSGGYGYLQALKNNQNNRNNYLTTEIEKLDNRIKEIKKLKTGKEDLLTRMEVIQSLQRERTQVIPIFDDIVRKLPDGVYFDSISKKAQQFNFIGTAQSNARVSNLMDNLGSSEWFSNPDLSVINVTPSKGVRLSQFSLSVSQIMEEKQPLSDKTEGQ